MPGVRSALTSDGTINTSGDLIAIDGCVENRVDSASLLGREIAASFAAETIFLGSMRRDALATNGGHL